MPDRFSVILQELDAAQRTIDAARRELGTQHAATLDEIEKGLHQLRERMLLLFKELTK